VASILLAFAIDAAWEERRERQEEGRILASLRAEFLVNQERVAQALDFHHGLRSNAYALMEASNAGLAPLPADSVDEMIAGVTWYGALFRPETSVVDAVVLGGQLHLIGDEELRPLLTRWRRELESLKTMELQEFDFYTQVWLPLLSARANIAQISNATTMRPDGVPFDALELGVMPVALDAFDHRPLLADPEFQNGLVVRSWISDDLIPAYQRLGSIVEEVLQALAGTAR
jgi:hypothetical protein